jgi:2-dehydropantoate 2-reductase
MNIVIVGAGAIGSLFGALLSKKNTVVLVGRLPHITTIQKNGLTITGKTRLHVKLPAVTSGEDVHILPDLVLLTVKAYDTEIAVSQVLPLLQKNTVLLSLQNGLDNLEKIEKHIKRNHILAGVTTHGALFSKPGIIIHTGKGTTILGELNGTHSERLKTVVRIFNEASIATSASNNSMREIWAKAIINSSINPLTAFFQCKNGYLLKNQVLENIVEQVCEESTHIANAEGIALSKKEMIQKTKKVIRDTASNYSSMLQSIQQGKKTEIASINARLVLLGKRHGINASLNEILTNLVTSLEEP